MRRIGSRGIDPPAHAGACRRRKLAALGKRANLLQTVVAADRLGLLAHEFHAVVVGRIVARGDHDAAVVAAVKVAKYTPSVPHIPDVVHIDAAVGQAAAHGIRQAGARQADVAPHGDALGLQELRVAARDPVGHIVIQLQGNPAA